MTILLGSESYKLTVDCADCRRVEEIYISTETSAPEVGVFMTDKGWTKELRSAWVWFCPEHGPKEPDAVV